ncbi:MAG TPA: fumarylacetoacetate hydrolase family protein [Cyclobacteriaceae bacterium]|nr:fumarylacetoacetate hydrolase family protein [Cyclobacteriaceae bacterium]HRJ83222.1 fumarylacetoacetate hydrolase family protein [Cyclobacteriaceae bacterium]
MRVYKTSSGILIENKDKYFLYQEDWDKFINNDHLFDKLQQITSVSAPIHQAAELIKNSILAPIANQELWACGVTYLRSKVGRQEESKTSGSGDFYARVYEAERPEVFFKATAHRVVGHGGKVRIRKDSTWDVPEPELTLVVTSSGKIIGYTIGNDMSSRSIEGENPLYLPQAKTYDGCAAIGPCIYVTDTPINPETVIQLDILRNGDTVYTDSIAINQMKRSLEELASFVYRECSFPYGCMIMTGTGIVPPSGFTLKAGDEIRIKIGNIGTLINFVS